MKDWKKLWNEFPERHKQVTFEAVLNYAALVLTRQHFQQNHYTFEDSLLYPNDALLSYIKI